jgi:formate-dependent nitrite reductase membrane component NrfD
MKATLAGFGRRVLKNLGVGVYAGEDGIAEKERDPEQTERPGTQEPYRSYYGRAVLKTTVWEWKVPAYFFTGGVAAGSAMLAAGADLTARPTLRRVGRLGGTVALGASTALLIADLGRPERFHHMLRVAKPTSPMSMGTWFLVAFSPGIGLAAASELLPSCLRKTTAGRLLTASARPAGLAAAVVAPTVASYTATLLSQTAVPAWNEAHPQLPFVFTGSAAASSGGLGMILAPVNETAPARMFAAYGACMELAGSFLLESRLGLAAQAYESGKAGRLRRASTGLTVAGLAGTVLLGGRSRVPAALSGAALMAGGLLQRFGVFEAGIISAKDPKYVTVPQRQRLEEQEQTSNAVSRS